MTHPHTLHAIAALWSLRRALVLLAEHRDALVLQQPQLGPARTRPRSLAALQAYDRLLRDERPDRLALAGAKVVESPAPGNLAVLELEDDIAAELADAIELAGLGAPDLLAWSGHWLAPYLAHTTQDARLRWLHLVLPVLSPDLARGVGQHLADVDERIRSVLGAGDDLWHLPGGPRCPACSQRLVHARTSPPDSGAWLVVCTASGCRCRGQGCGCGMPVRAARVRHAWTAAVWLELAPEAYAEVLAA